MQLQMEGFRSCAKLFTFNASNITVMLCSLCALFAGEKTRPLSSTFWCLTLILCYCSNEPEEHSIEVHNSRRPFDRLTLNVTLTFDLILICGRGIVMNYLCANCLAILVSAVLVLTCGQTDRQTDRGA